MHLVDDASASYRWELFPWLAGEAKAEKVKSLIICGDLTDRKDNHGADLVNRIVKELVALQKVIPDIKILAGNHDWLLRGQEYFRFLNHLDGIRFITDPWEDQDTKGPLTYYLPYSKNPSADWKGLDLSHYAYVFMHQTVKGAIASNGEAMEGEQLPDLSSAGKVYSGDIHVPQVIGPVEYIGSPYHVHFGDAFKPRVILLERDGNPVDLRFKTISRVTLRVPSLKALYHKNLRPGDQVKVKLELGEADKHDWAKIRREAKAYLREAQVVDCGIELVVVKSGARIEAPRARAISRSPSEAVTQFVINEELGADVLDVGLDIIEGKL